MAHTEKCTQFIRKSVPSSYGKVYPVHTEKCTQFMAEKSDINAVGARFYRDGKKSLRYIQVYTGIYRARVKRGGLHFISPPRHAFPQKKRRDETRGKSPPYPLCLPRTLKISAARRKKYSIKKHERSKQYELRERVKQRATNNRQ